MKGDRRFLHVDAESIHRDVQRAVNEAMAGLHEALEGLHDIPFAVPFHEPGRPRGKEHSHSSERWGTDERADDTTRDTLQALERGEISVDEAMERLGEPAR